MSLQLLKTLAKKNGLTVKDCGNGHVQIIGGAVVVNYWPDSRHRSAYIASTRGSKRSVTPEEAVEMALKPIPFTGCFKRSRNKARRFKENAFKKNPKQSCHWCGKPLTPETATVDHRIPLARNGLDHHNNMVLACYPCNHDRGHAMPTKPQQLGEVHG